MNATLRTIVVMLAALALAGAFGCAKKKIDTGPTPVAGEASGPAVSGQDQDQDEVYRQRELAEEEARRERELEEERRQEAVAEAQEKLGDIIFFDFDSYELQPEARRLLQAKAEVLKQFPDLQLVIKGYADERGTEEYNLALGERRARAAYEFLVLLGINPSRMSIVSYGEENPLDPGNNETAWARNRRAEFEVVTD